MVRHVLGHNAIRTDRHIISNANRSHNLGARTDVHVASDDGRSFAPSSIGLTDRHSLADVAILSDHGPLVDDDVADMADVKATANGGAMGNRAAELVFVSREHPHPNPVEGPIKHSRLLPLEVPAQAEIEHVLDAVTETLAPVRKEDVGEQMTPGALSRVAVEIGSPQFPQLGERHRRRLTVKS